jgi:hypothetical protein
VSEQFGQSLKDFLRRPRARGAAHPRYGCTSSPRAAATCWAAKHKLATPLGYLGAFLTNSLHRKAMGAWLERVVFSTPDASCPLPPATTARARCDAERRQLQLALQASCSIPFVLRSVHNMPGGAARRLLGRRHHRLPPAPELRAI